MVAAEEKVFYELSCPTQNYDWGRLGKDSLVAKLSGANDLDKPYAELWMGTHPSGPAHIKGSGKELTSLVGNLPFLFKVLSIRKALSIQAHPDEQLAKQLHAQFPQIYRDPHHKPEVIIALTPFEALSGFRQIGEIKDNLKAIPEFGALVKQPLVSASDLKPFFAELMQCPTEQVKAQLAKLKQRCSQHPSELEALILRLDSQFPDEVGSFCCLILNYAQLQPGQALFLAANEPHAYLSGEGVECMAPSDNVVRAGLTPKFRDVDTLVKMLTYRTYSLSELILPAKQIAKHQTLYAPPVSEFSVLKISIPEGQSELVPSHAKPSILIVICGSGAIKFNSGADETKVAKDSCDIKLGSILYVKENQSMEINSSGEPLLIFVARQP